MPRRRKYAKYNAAGCKICGDKTVGRGISKHVEGEHSVKYAAYKQCFGAECKGSFREPTSHSRRGSLPEKSRAPA